MEKTPCEYIFWNVLPSIRKEICRSLIENNDLNQSQAAEKLGITTAAVCQYLSDKRGCFNIADSYILSEINKSAKVILKHGSTQLGNETCRICSLLKVRKIMTKR